MLESIQEWMRNRKSLTLADRAFERDLGCDLGRDVVESCRSRVECSEQTVGEEFVGTASKLAMYARRVNVC